MERREDYSIGKYVLTYGKIFNVEKNPTIRNKYDFQCSYKKTAIGSFNEIEEIIDYCIENKIEIYAHEKDGTITKLNDVAFVDVVLKRSIRLMLWQGKDLVNAFEFKNKE